MCLFAGLGLWTYDGGSEEGFHKFQNILGWLIVLSLFWGVGAMIWDVWHWPRWKQQKEIKQQRKRKENEHAQRYSSPAPPATTVTMDIPTQIRKFAELRDQGLITEDEFQEQKTKLLSYFQK